MENLELDQKQHEIWQKFQKNVKILQKEQKKSFFDGFLQKNEERPLNFYIYSAPGRGKTMMMRKFYEELGDFPKVYWHFNEFMQKIHENLHKIRKSEKKTEDELIAALKMVLGKAKFVCFDEFQVQDIADAMLLGRIFAYFFANGVNVLITSNTRPEDLYKGGLQREIFLDFIYNVLLKNVEVIALESEIDYRLNYQQSLDKRYFVNTESARLEVAEIIAKSSDGDDFKPRMLQVWGRELKIEKTFGEVAVLDFANICQKDLAAADYRAICKEFSLIFLLNLPVLDRDMVNEARRFMLFIDEVYENRVAMVVLAEVEIEGLYGDKKMAEASARVISRLNEIKSDFYYTNSKLFVK